MRTQDSIGTSTSGWMEPRSSTCGFSSSTITLFGQEASSAASSGLILGCGILLVPFLEGEACSDDHRQHRQCVVSPDLLAFLIGASPVADRHFIAGPRPRIGAGQNLRMLLPTVRNQFLGPEQAASIQ